MYRQAILPAVACGLIACANGAEPNKNTPKPSTAATPTKPAAAMGTPSSDTVIATWKGGKMTYGELLNDHKSDFRNFRNSQKTDAHAFETQRLEASIVQKLVKAAADAKGQSEEDYMKGEVGSGEVTDEEVKAFAASNPNLKGKEVDENLANRIKAFLGQQKQQRAIVAVFEKLKKEAGVEMNLPQPELEKVAFDLAGRPTKGKADAKVTIVEFSDFECPFCSRAVEGVEKLVEAYPNDVKVVFMHFPLSMHPRALPAAIASQCANVQGKFWTFHDELFENQREMSDEKLQAYAEKTGLDVDKFKKCVADPATEAFVKKDMEQGNEAGVQGTPSFFINGEQQQGGVPTVEAVKRYVEG